MTYLILCLLGMLSFVLMIVSIAVATDSRGGSRRELIARLLILPLALSSIVTLAVMWRYGYSVSLGEVGVRVDGIRYSEFKESTMCWQRNCILIAANSEIEGAVQPITDNPKVRHLKYKLEVTIVDPTAFARAVQLTPGQKCPGDGPNRCQLNDAVLYEIYEFNNANSKELAKYYNPYDKNQTSELQKLLNIKLTPPLMAKGINFVRLVSWSVE